MGCWCPSAVWWCITWPYARRFAFYRFYRIVNVYRFIVVVVVVVVFTLNSFSTERHQQYNRVHRGSLAYREKPNNVVIVFELPTYVRYGLLESLSNVNTETFGTISNANQ